MTIYWLAWILLFVAGEAVALKSRREGDTFTEEFRRVLKLKAAMRQPSVRGTVGLWGMRIVVIVFGVWLTCHMAFGVWGGGGS